MMLCCYDCEYNMYTVCILYVSYYCIRNMYTVVEYSDFGIRGHNYEGKHIHVNIIISVSAVV